VSLSRAAALVLVAACAAAPQPAPLHNVAVAGPAPAVKGPRCPVLPPPRVAPPAPALGAIAGVVIDDACEPLAGATVVVRSQRRHNHAEITDEAGRFAMPDLPPGIYVVAVYYLDTTLERGGVLIRAGAIERVQLAMPPPAKSEPRITHDLTPP
jgi:hypothetical protein